MSRRVTVSDESFGLLEYMENLSIDDVILMFSKVYIGISVAKNGKSEIPDTGEIYDKIQHLILTVSQYEKLCSVYNRESVDVVISEMKNYAKLKKYKNAYLTANKWLKNRGQSALKSAGSAKVLEFGSKEWREQNA